MNESIGEKVSTLKSMLDSDERIVALNKLDKEMSNNEEVMKLSYALDVASSKYSDMLSIYSENSKEVKEARLALVKAKENLYSHPLVKQYLEEYKKVRELYAEIDDILFSDFAVKLCPKE